MAKTLIKAREAEDEKYYSFKTIVASIANVKEEFVELKILEYSRYK